MAHDVFVSHSSKDKLTADAVCAVLESHGIRCWVAPRDILPGREWGASIIEAIKGAKVMVLIFSAHANSSPQINKEVERAVNKGIPVIPMRIENVVPTDSLEYFLSSNHWLDAYSQPLESHLQHLAEIVRQIIGQPVEEMLPGADDQTGTHSNDSAARAVPGKDCGTGATSGATAGKSPTVGCDFRHCFIVGCRLVFCG